ncbi:hypothetical protein [Okeania sp. SIO2B3]|uniref:hypothetical protein n=1 Tax=Okeania sp. SIO2B3 TaxID=2607784 RepID=UPI0013C0D44C|nr:hypothetical protein [Okeania sp. SIO2B3]NET43463.1 hypothetical protein [Okeania sp. SIO2B3]
MRNWLYFIVGLLASVLGWSFSQILLVDFKPIWDSLDLTFFAQYPYLIKFFIVTIFLAVAMVMAEVFFSHPTRLKQGWKVLKLPLRFAIVASILGAILSGIISFVLKLTIFPAWTIRLIDWLIIGLVIGFAEGITWLLRTWSKLVLNKTTIGGIQNDTTKVINHFVKSICLSLIVSLIVFIFSEIIIKQDIWSFILLGTMLGFALSFTESPNSQFALKAGYGFERISGGNTTTNNLNRQTYKDRRLKLVYAPSGNQLTIQEGLSIELPKTGNIIIGSDVEQADIIVNDLPGQIATIKINGRNATIENFSNNILKKLPSEIVIKPPETVNNTAPNPYANISNQPENSSPNLDKDLELIDYPNEIELYHNTVITLYTKNQSSRKYVRFVFYDRFLDPEA